MSEELKTKIWEWFAHLTVQRLLISALALTIGIGAYVGYENRQKIFEQVTKDTKITNSTYRVASPNSNQQELVRRFLAKHPNVKFITLIRADPILNRRLVIHRFSLDSKVIEYFEQVVKVNPEAGDGPLLTDDVENNSQILAIINGEYMCSRPQGGIVQRTFPEIAGDIKLSCRVPVPPQALRTGGWFAMHLTDDTPDLTLKTDALTMSLMFFEASK